MELNGPQSKQLSEALMDAFPKNNDLKRMLFHELGEKLNQISQDDTYKQIVFYVIEYFQAQGKIEELIKAALQDNPTNPKLLDFKSCYLNPITENNLNQLKNIIDKIDFNIVKLAYQKTLPNDFFIDNFELNCLQTIETIIDALSKKYTVINNKFPSLLEFAKQIASQLQDNTSEYKQLENWCKQVAEKFKITIDIRPAPKDEIKSASYHSYLLIFVYPETHKDGDKFRLEAEYVFCKERETKPQPLDLQILLNIIPKVDNFEKGILCDSLDKIAEQMGKILKSFMTRFPEETLYLTLEIFLPYKYLGENIDDKWRIQNDFRDYVPIVTENIYMIVRPLERFIPGTLISRNFRQGWTRLQETLNNNTIPDYILNKIENIQVFDSRNSPKISNNLKTKIGLKLTSPIPKNSREQEKFWQTILSGGVPLAFWTRCEAPAHFNLDEIDCYLKIECLQNDLQKFIENMCEIRSNAYAEENPSEHLGYHLGVLCDNPNRIPSGIKALQEFKVG